MSNKEKRHSIHLMLNKRALEAKSISVHIDDCDEVHFEVPVSSGPVLERSYVDCMLGLGLTDGDLDEMVDECNAMACRKLIGRCIS